MPLPHPLPDPLKPLADSAALPVPGARRRFLAQAAGTMAPLMASAAWAQTGNSAADNRIDFPSDYAPSEMQERSPDPADPPSRRIGFAVVGIGRLTVNQIMPAFGKTRHCKPVALVSGDRDKALKLARQHDIRDEAVYDYRNFDRIAQNADVDVVYIVLPNSLHLEYTVRAAQAGKHVLCEKPMAMNVRECQQMIDACKTANRQLMIAYRSQYEPKNQAILRMVREKKFGTLKEFISTNSQFQGNPAQWRLKKALAGGGALPDIGLYCLNASRFVSGEEPSEVAAWMYSTPGDPRFSEVEETMHFMMRFPSGLQATCHTSYGTHRAQFMRLMGTDAWAELDPAYAYQGIRLRIGDVADGKERVIEPNIAEKDQFAMEMDHMAECVRSNRMPHTPGEEGLQDHRIMEALYASARADGKTVRLSAPQGPTRGPAPEQPSA